MIKVTSRNLMKYVSIRFGLSCLLAGLFLFGAESWAETEDAKAPQKAADKGPRLSIAEPSFDLGEISAADKAVHIYKIRNVGEETLHIKNLKAG